MRRMELQAVATDSAVKKLGNDLDKNVGTTKQTRQIENLGRSSRTAQRDIDSLGGSRGGRGVRQLGRDSDSAAGKLDRLLLRLVRFGVIVKALKFAGLAAGIGILVQAIGNVATGLAAMVPALTRAVGVLGTMVGPAISLGGALAALPATMIGIAGGAAVARFAFSDLSQAMKGNQQALKRLTPEARKFLDMFNKEYRPMLNRLRATAQGGIFSGLTVALADMRRAFPTVNALIGDFSRRLGDLARQAGAQFSQAGFLRDLFSIGQQGGRILSRFGTGVLNMIDALRHVAVAAQPFTEWLSRTVVAWTRFVDQWALAGRESGRFASFLSNVRARLLILFDVVRNLTVAAEGFFRAADPTGMGLFRSLDEATKRWAAFASSVTGEARIRVWAQNAAKDFHLIWDVLVQLGQVLINLGRVAGTTGDTLWGNFDRFLRRWNEWASSTPGQLQLMKDFQTVVPGFEAIARFLGAIGLAILRMGQNPALAGMTTNLQRLLPMLENFLNTMVTQLGPPLINLLVQVGKLLTTLTQAGGPLNLFLQLTGKVLSFINSLVHGIPGLGFALAAAFSVVLINRFIAKIGQATVAMFGLRTAATETAIANSAALGGGVVGGLERTAGGVILPAGVRGAEAAAGGGRMARLLGRVGLGGVAARFGGLASRVPLLGRLGGLGAEGSMLARFGTPLGLGAGLAGLSLGFLPGAQTPGTTTNKIATIGGGVATGAGIGAMAGLIGGPLAPVSVPVGAAIGAGLGGLYGAAKAFHPLGLFGHGPSAQDVIGQAEAPLRGMGGNDPAHAQLVRQVAYLRSQTRKYAQDTSSTGQTVLAALQQELQARSAVLGQQNAQIRAERQIRQENSRRVNVARARSYGRALGVGYDRDVAAMGQPAAFNQLLDRYKRLARGLSEQGRMALAKPLVDWANQLHQRGKLPMDELDKLNGSVKRSFDDTRQHIEIVNGQILTGTTRGWTAIKNALLTQANLAKAGLANSFSQIDALARGKLTAMGYNPAQIRQILTAASTVGGSITMAGGKVTSTHVPGGMDMNTAAAKALGGRVGGRSREDSVPIMAGAGELVVNRHTEGKVNSMLAPYGTSLGSMANLEGKRHGFATGGRAGGMWAGVHPAVRQAANILTSRFPLSVTSTTHGGHAAGSYHYLGEAVDLGGSTGAMNRAAAWIGSSGMASSLTEGIHNPNLSVKNGRSVPSGFWGASTWAEHANHIHIAIAGALGRLGGGASRQVGLRAPRINIGGVPGMLAQAGANAYAAGFAGAVTSHLPAGGGGGHRVGGGGGAGGGLAGGTSGQNQALGRRMMLQHGWAAGQWPALRALWTRESGWSASARNPSSGAYGIPQSLPGSKMASAGADWRTNPATQIRWGLGYIGGRYGSPSAALAHSNAVGWYGRGMSGTFHRPTIIGVGDSGSEDVTVTPAHSRGAGGIRVNIERIDYRGEGDIEKVVTRELEAAFSRFGDELGRIGVEND